MSGTTQAEANAPPDPSRGFSRRSLLLGGLAAAGLAVGAGGAAAGFELSSNSSEPAGPPSGGSPAVLAFRSRPDLSPPRIQMTVVGTPTTSAFLITPNFGPAGTGAGQQGLMILDGRGELVWFHPLAPSFSNLQVQTYRGEPVLTWWQGKFMAAGFGQGVGVVADRSYRQVATVKAGNGLAVDLHELVLTPGGSALITAVDTVPADLRPVGGPAAVTAYTGVVQEVDVATGKVLFQWRSIDHVPVDESHATPDTGTFDYFHVNSIDIDPEDGNLLVSARNTWTVYKLDRSSGAVVWRLGGKRSDFSMGPGAGFAWQHDARAQGRGVVTIFDDGASPAVETHSRAIWLTLDEAARTARLEKAFTHPARLVAENQGSLRVLADGDPIVGWGSEPYFSHFDSRGGLLRDGRMPTNLESYRAFRSPWAGASTGVPDIATETDNVGGAAVYVSWNGATDVSTWQVWTGTDPSALQESGSVPKGGFETAITVHQKGPYVAVRALDANGTTLATSKAVHL